MLNRASRTFAYWDRRLEEALIVYGRLATIYDHENETTITGY
jgi:hypothetical protein